MQNVCANSQSKSLEKAKEKNWRYKGKEAYFTAFSELRENIGPSKCKLILKNISSMSQPVHSEGDQPGGVLWKA